MLRKWVVVSVLAVAPQGPVKFSLCFPSCPSIMRGSFLYLSLGLLFCVLPVLCENYHVHSQNPDRFIVSTGYEKDGDLVETVPKSNKGFPLHTVVDIDPPVSDTEPTEGVVSGKAGLFIGISKVGNELEWHTNPYKWVFNLATEDPYHIIFQPKENEVWLDSNYDQVVELVEAPVTGPGDAFWKIDKAMQN